MGRQNKFIELDVTEDHTIQQVKELIQEKTSIAIEKQRLLREIEDDQTLSNLGCTGTSAITPGEEFPKENYFYLVVAEPRRRLTNQSLITCDGFIRESTRCQQS